LAHLSVFDLTGRELLHRDDEKATDSCDVSTLAPGMYWVQANGSNGAIYSFKILKD
jgi:hypothetical protein